MSELEWWEKPQWCSHCNRDVTYFGHASDCADYISPNHVQQRIDDAVAAEREACCAVNAKLLEACEALVVRIDEWMALDMPCPLCDGYVPHFDDCPYTFAAAAIRVRTGEGEIDNPPVV